MPCSHVKCMPKWRITLAFAQFRAVPAMVCKIADDSLPRFESWTCHQKPQVKPSARTAPRRRAGAEPNTADAACANENRPVAASSKIPGDQPGCENNQSGPLLPRDGESRE